ncbi:MAG: S8 family peptidase [Saprospiraceae bacterium]|nr:S8 family peptidase [Saprospiraceae bacterium]
MMKRIFLSVVFWLGAIAFIFAQEKPPLDWFHLDPDRDSFPGVSTQQTYRELLKNAKGRTVIVAILDSGVDFEHEDLKDVMWVNADEIPDNNIDDDKNGYVDDIHGWSFLGNAKGENVVHDNLEITRQYRILSKKFDGKKPTGISKDDKADYDKYLKYKKIIEEKITGLQQEVPLYEAVYNAIVNLEKALNKDSITLTDIKKFRSRDRILMAAAAQMEQFMDGGDSFEKVKEDIKSYYEQQHSRLNYGYNVDYDPRKIVGDNINDPYERYYGNNDVRGPDAMHGTHVAGIIGAARDNGIGINGIAANVRIMSVRTVPDGDERDKDVANAIIYAVDNGASVINMSFGKGESPNKEAVDKAVKYALKNDVLIVQAAGNDAQENDYMNTFPNDKFKKKSLFGPKYADNWITVGALNWDKDAAKFSNFSGENVDVFAPGTEIYSTVPDSKYEISQGTSMASPVVAGVAATLRAYFPKLNAKQVKDIIMQSVVPIKDKVNKPGTSDLVPFNQLCVSGGTINMYRAVQLAQRTKGKRKADWGHKDKKATAIP